MEMRLEGLSKVFFCGVMLFHLVAASPWILRDYKVCRHQYLQGIDDNASGVTYDKGSGTIWVVSRSPLEMIQYDLHGNLKQRKGMPEIYDPEGVAYMWNGHFAVADEPSNIKELSLEDSYWMRESNSLWINLKSWGWNSGIEGLAYDHWRGVFYAAQEKGDKAIIEVSQRGDVKVLFTANHIGVRDLSGLYYCVWEDVFFILSQESKVIVKVARDGSLLETLNVGGYRPEGLAFSQDGHTMIVVAEPNELIVYNDGTCHESDN